MATIYRAQLSPPKAEVLTSIARSRGWSGPGDELTPIGSYRFDDPEGEVGIETHLVDVGGRVVQIPLTYRGAALDDAGDTVLATMRHSVLGQRFVHDACGDPVYVQALVTAILTGGVGADFEVHHDDGRREIRARTVEVAGSGASGTLVPAIDAVTWDAGRAASTIRAAGLEIVVGHEVATPLTGDGPALRGSWAGSGVARTLAYLRH